MFKKIYNKKGNSIIEVVVVIVILTSGLVGAYAIVNNGQKLALTTENRIKAINIAREGIEAITNIRDTNWIKFSSDYKNCWNVSNYNPACIGSTITIPVMNSGIIYQNGSLWYMTGATNSGVYLDDNGMNYQTGVLSTSWDSIKCTPTKNKSCKTIFTRAININTSFQSGSMVVNSIVKWVDNSSPLPHTINLETTLTNRKEDL